MWLGVKWAVKGALPWWCWVSGWSPRGHSQATVGPGHMVYLALQGEPNDNIPLHRQTLIKPSNMHLETCEK